MLIGGSPKLPDCAATPRNLLLYEPSSHINPTTASCAVSAINSGDDVDTSWLIDGPRTA